MPVLKREEYPACLLRSHALKGVFVGGCVVRGDGSSFRAKAHAHTQEPYKGWLCVRKRERLTDTALMIHELAHLVTGQGHTDTWRKKVLELGGTLDKTASLKSFHKKVKVLTKQEAAEVIFNAVKSITPVAPPTEMEGDKDGWHIRLAVRHGAAELWQLFNGNNPESSPTLKSAVQKWMQDEQRKNR